MKLTELFGNGLSDAEDDRDWEPVPESQRVAPLQEAAAELALAEKRAAIAVARFQAGLSPKERAFLGHHHGSGDDGPLGRNGKNAMPKDKRDSLIDIFKRRFGTALGPAELSSSARPSEVPVFGTGLRHCRWCRECIATEADDFDHDFCEPDEPTERLAAPPSEPAPRPVREPEPPPFELSVESSVRCVCGNWRAYKLAVSAPPGSFGYGRDLVSSAVIACACGNEIRLAYSWTRRQVIALRHEKKPVLH